MRGIQCCKQLLDVDKQKVVQQFQKKNYQAQICTDKQFCPNWLSTHHTSVLHLPCNPALKSNTFLTECLVSNLLQSHLVSQSYQSHLFSALLISIKYTPKYTYLQHYFQTAINGISCHKKQIQISTAILHTSSSSKYTFLSCKCMCFPLHRQK